MRSQQPTPTPNWKEVIFAGPEWPVNLMIPQTDQLAEDSECIQDSMSTNEHWEWELWRHPDGHCYYLKVWPMNFAEFDNPKTPGVALSVTEAFHFMMNNWMPRDVIADLAFERPGLWKSLDLPPGSPGLN